MNATKPMNTNHETPDKPRNNPTEDEIAECAYYIWESEGHPIGKEEEHWRQAELQLYLSRAHEDALESNSATF